jgi:hypothetical protein
LQYNISSTDFVKIIPALPVFLKPTIRERTVAQPFGLGGSWQSREIVPERANIILSNNLSTYQSLRRLEGRIKKENVTAV